MITEPLKKRVEGPSPGLNTWLVLHIICCFQNGSNFGKEHGKAHKQSLSCLAALVICLGLQVKNFSLPWEDQSTFQLCNLEESDSLRRRSLRKVHSSSKAQHSKEVGRKYAPIPYLHCCDVVERPSNILRGYKCCFLSIYYQLDNQSLKVSLDFCIIKLAKG